MVSALRPEAGPSRPLRKDAARNRAALLQAAREVFAARGIEASLDEIAHHAGVGVGTAYRHFANKHELVAACAQQAFEQVVRFAQDGLATPSPWDGLVAFIENVAQSQAENRGLREIIAGEYEPQQLSATRQQLFDAVAQLLARAQTARLVRADAEPSDLGMILIMLSAVSDVAAAAEPALWRRYLPMLLDGLRPGGTALAGQALSAQALAEAIASHKTALYGPRK